MATNEVTFEIKERLYDMYDVLIDGKIVAEALDESDAKMFLDLAKAFSAKNDEIAALCEALQKIADMDGESFANAFAKCVDTAREALKGSTK